MGGTCGTYGIGDEYMQGFGGETCTNGTTSKALTAFIRFRMMTNAGFCEHGDEPLGLINREEFLD
jgi:hypothetical protein